jgi:hypothetical protein
MGLLDHCFDPDQLPIQGGLLGRLVALQRIRSIQRLYANMHAKRGLFRLLRGGTRLCSRRNS